MPIKWQWLVSLVLIFQAWYITEGLKAKLDTIPQFTLHTLDNITSKLPSRTHKNITILMYSQKRIDSFWGTGTAKRRAEIGNNCSSNCRYTLNPNNAFDAVLFHIGMHIGTRFFKTFWQEYNFTVLPLTGIFLSEADDDKARAKSDKEAFDIRVSYSFEPDVFSGQSCQGLLNLQEMVRNRASNTDWLKIQFERRGTTVGAISNCGSPFRNKYISNLMQHLQIDQLGRCFQGQKKVATTRGSPVWQSKKIDDFKNYRFALAMENKNKEDYISEKIWDAYVAGTIPIYHGTTKVHDFVPPNSHLNADDYQDPETLAKKIKEISNNYTLYKTFFQWDESDLLRKIKKYKCDRHWLCQLCDQFLQKQSAL